MFSSIFNTVFYEPIYNGLVFLISVSPNMDVGISIIVLTVVVKFIILPFSHKSIKTQAKTKIIEPEVNKLKEKYKDDKQEQARQVMELYKAHGVNPMTGCLLVFIQLPIIFALYHVFLNGIQEINTEIVYGFIKIPQNINMNFLGIFDLTESNIFLAIFAGVLQYYQMKFSLPPVVQKDSISVKKGEMSFKDEFARNMTTQMRYFLPLLIAFIAYKFSSVIALYLIVNSLFSVIHEFIVRKKAEEISGVAKVSL